MHRLPGLRDSMQGQQGPGARPQNLSGRDRGAETGGGSASGRLYFHALFSLSSTLVRGGLPHWGHAGPGPGRVGIRGSVPVRRLQDLYVGLSLGSAAMAG